MIGLHSLLWASTLEHSKETIPNVKLRYNLYSFIPPVVQQLASTFYVLVPHGFTNM